MCGPSSQQSQLANQESTFMANLQSNYNTNFANQAGILSGINSVLSPILAKGPSQTGFSEAENNALNTQAINSTGAATQNAEAAVGGQLAGRGDDSGLESGVDQQIKAGVASKGAGELANEELGITEANYAAGRQNFNTALAGEESTAGLLNPNAIAESANEANKNAFGEETEINQEQNQEESDIAGGIAGLGMDVATFGAGAAGGGGLSGGLKALAGVGG
jgi:hypothetical protein